MFEDGHFHIVVFPEKDTQKTKSMMNDAYIMKGCLVDGCQNGYAQISCKQELSFQWIFSTSEIKLQKHVFEELLRGNETQLYP